jgi:hypothetical protein
MTCCICFYGATRTLPSNLESITGVINQFRELFDVKIFVHTWNDNDDFKLLNPDYYRTSDLQEVIKKLPIDKIEKNTKEFLTNLHGNKFKRDYEIQYVKEHITGNLLGLYCLKQVTLLALSKFPSAQFYVIIRPDSRFEHFHLKPMLKLIDANSDQPQIITPAFDNYYFDEASKSAKADYTGKKGVNDRFSICYGSEAFRIIGTRYDLMPELSKRTLFIGEPLLDYVIKEFKIKNNRTKMCLLLVRLNGKVLGWCNKNGEIITRFS